MFNPNRCGCVAAVFWPRATMPLRYRRYCDICISFPQSTAPESHISAGVQSSQSEGQGKRVWSRGGRRGDRMPLCASAVWWDVEVFQMQLKGPPGVKRLFVIITDTSHRLKACRATTTHKLLDFTLESIPFPDYFLSHKTNNNFRPARADTCTDVCPSSGLQCLRVRLSLFVPFLLFCFLFL